MFGFGDTVTILRLPAQPATTRYGTAPDWANATATTVANVSVQPETSSEDVANRDTVTTRYHLYSAPAGDLDLTAYDRVQWNGLTLEVLGDVQRWPLPLGGGVHHVEAVLRRIEG